MSVKPYLQLTRAHTAPLEAGPAILGAALALGEFWNTSVLLWGIFGILYHLTGYGMNSLTDWLSGHDVDDPHKQHHPLNAGTLTYRQVSFFIAILLASTFTYALYLTWNSILGMITIVVMVAAGSLYNFVSKITILKWIPISVSHTLVFVAPYLTLGGSPTDRVFLLSTLYVFLWVGYQIGISGEIKDIMQLDEANILRTLGVIPVSVAHSESEFEYRSIETPVGVVAIVMIVKFISIILALRIFLRLGPYAAITMLGIVGLGALAMYHSVETVKSGVYNRKSRIESMSSVEAIMLFMFAGAMIPVIGEASFVAIVVGSVIWVITLNKYQWGTLLAPEV